MSTGEDLLAVVGEDILGALEGTLTEIKDYLDEHANDRLGHKLTGKIELLLSMLAEIEEVEEEDGEEYDPDDEDYSGDEEDDEAPFADAHAAGEEGDDDPEDEDDPV